MGLSRVAQIKQMMNKVDADIFEHVHEDSEMKIEDEEEGGFSPRREE